jgi:hypothetical protein
MFFYFFPSFEVNKKGSNDLACHSTLLPIVLTVYTAASGVKQLVKTSPVSTMIAIVVLYG